MVETEIGQLGKYQFAQKRNLSFKVVENRMSLAASLLGTHCDGGQKCQMQMDCFQQCGGEEARRIEVLTPLYLIPVDFIDLLQLGVIITQQNTAEVKVSSE